MALAMPSARRFFAAFHRWSCSAHHTECRLVPCSRLPRPERLYSSTSYLLQHNAVNPTSSPSMKTAIRNLMRHVPSSVSIITVCANHPGEQKAQVLPVGSAISSLTMVTLDPPHVSFNIKTPSRTFSAIREAGDSFRVHFLDASLEAAKIAHNFTQGNSEQVLAERAHMFSFATDPTNESKPGPPRIVSSAVVASMSCRLVHEAFVADHVVAIARVEEFRSGEELKPTLLYHQGKYKKNTGSVLLDPQLHAKPIEKYTEPSVRDVTDPEPEGIRTP